MASSVLFPCVLVILAITVDLGQSIRCFDCNSGANGWMNENCPVNGDLAMGSGVTLVDCDEFCFARTDKWNPGTIFRGCSKQFYIPRPVDPNGCMKDGWGDYWCFCDGDECNTMSMADKR